MPGFLGPFTLYTTSFDLLPRVFYGGSAAAALQGSIQRHAQTRMNIE